MRSDELLTAVAREADVLAALSTAEWLNFEHVREETGLAGRHVRSSLLRLMKQGKIQKRGHGLMEAYRRQPGKPGRCEACGRSFLEGESA